jgi:hypothetical protein
VETLVAKSRRRPPKQRWRLAFALGARSAFDMFGLGTFHNAVLRPGSVRRADPPEMIARDMARVVDRFGRSAACARRALEAGIKIEDLEAGCTANGDSPESGDLIPRHKRYHATTPKSID